MSAASSNRERFADLLTTIGLGRALRHARRLRRAARLPVLDAAGHVPDWRYRRWIASREQRPTSTFDSGRVAVATPETAADSACEFVAILHPGNELAPRALAEMERMICANPDADLIYSDEDEIDAAGQRCKPRFKPDWSPEYLRSTNYVGGLLVLRRELIRELGPSQGEYDLILKAGERARQIIHAPQILYHRLQRVDSSADAAALRDHLQRVGLDAEVSPREGPGRFCIRYRHARQPLVSVIIPTRDRAALLERCLSAVSQNNYANVEIIIIENGSVEPATAELYGRWRRRPNVRLLSWDRPFNFAVVNNFAASLAKGELLLFLNNDIEADRRDWLERMIELALLPGVGAVGARLLYPDGAIQHAGVVVGMHGVAGHPHHYFRGDHPGYLGRLQLPHNVAAVTGACLLVSHAAFEQVGGFDEEFAVTYNDVDFCLKLQRAGYRNVWTPDAELIHHESKTRGHDDSALARERLRREVERFRQKWASFLQQGDPYFSPHFDLERTDFCLG